MERIKAIKMKGVLLLIPFLLFTSDNKSEKIYRIGWAQGFNACYEILRSTGNAPWKPDSIIQKMRMNRFGADSIWFKDEYLKYNQ